MSLLDKLARAGHDRGGHAHEHGEAACACPPGTLCSCAAGLGPSGVGAEILRELRGHHELARKHYAKRTDDEWVQHRTIDLASEQQVTIPISRENVRGIYVENLTVALNLVGVWLGTHADNGPPFFTVANGHFKALPVNPFDSVRTVTIATIPAQTAQIAGSIVRVIACSYFIGPMQGAT